VEDACWYLPTDIPRRPSAGGRFPSDLEVNARRGLAAPPLSPSSTASGLVEDRDVITAANSMPSAPPGRYAVQDDGADPRNAPGYGNTAHMPMTEAPSHALMASRDAHDDGVNPYTSEPMAQNHRANHAYMSNVAGASYLAQPASYHEPAGAGHEDSYSQGNAQGGFADTHQLPVELAAAASSYPAQQPVPNVGGAYTVASPNTGYETQNTHTDGSGEAQNVEPRTMSQANGAVSKSVRPTANTVRNDSVPTISNLHIPGEYPRNTPTAWEELWDVFGYSSRCCEDEGDFCIEPCTS